MSAPPNPPVQPPSMRSLGTVAAICSGIGLITILATIAWGHAGGKPSSATEEYGRRLISQTTEYLGPDVPDPKMRYTNSRLACASCHINAGTEPGNLSLMTAIAKYPRISPRSGGKETIEDRINGCMIRSMNGRALSEDSPEMIAMVSYLRFLDDEDAAMGASLKESRDGPAFKTPDRKANLQAGEQVFDKRCADCHGKDGAGLPASTKLVEGYLFPPLWGANSFNDGAGMHRVLTAARFIKAKMPLGKADLDDDDAFDVAAWINSRPRPEMPNLDRDYPNRRQKPIDTSYGPWADPFPQEQHQFGPFPPIEAYYKKP